jgi:hypothetical protein
MATVEWMDGFDHYIQSTGSTTVMDGDMALKWTGAGGGSMTRYVSPLYARYPGSGGGGLYMTSGGSSRYIWKALPGGSQATRNAAFHFKQQSGLGTQCICCFLDNNTEQVSLRIDGANKLTVNRVSTVLATSTNTLALNTWYHIEFKVTISDTVGVVEVKVDGTSTNWIPQTGSLDTKQTANATADQFGLGSPSLQFNSGITVDDLVIADDFVGKGQVLTVTPYGPGSQSDWTPNYSSNFAAVNELNSIDYEYGMVSDTVANSIDLFPFRQISSGATIHAIQHNIVHRQDAGAARTIRRVQKRSGTSYNGSNINQSASWQLYTECLNTDPSTGSAWTTANFNAAEFGYELVS